MVEAKGQRLDPLEETTIDPRVTVSTREGATASTGSVSATTPTSEAMLQGRQFQQLGEFRIVREIGRGGMGIVYEAVQESLGRRVALKVLPFQGHMDESYLQRFQVEAKSAARLHHPNIVPVFGVGEHEGIHYYAMQYIEGQGLDSVIEAVTQLRTPQSPGAALQSSAAHRGAGDATSSVALGLLTGSLVSTGEIIPEVTVAPAPPMAPKGMPSNGAKPGSPLSTRSESSPAYFRGVAQVTLQVAQALAYANSEGVLHRDIKPSNLLVDQQGKVWVTDFGLAKAEGDQLTQTGDIVGTLAYMAPERFEGWADPRGDIYSLGLTLYEMMTLCPAFGDIDRHRLIKKVMEGEVQRPRKIDSRIPVDLETIAMKAMAKEPAQRYQTASELAEDLDRFLGHKAIRARPPSPGYLLKIWAKRHRTALSAAGTVLLLTILAFGTASWYSRRSQFLQAVSETEGLIGIAAVDAARDSLTQLERAHRGRPEVVGLALRLGDKLLQLGKAEWTQLQGLRGKIRGLQAEHEKILYEKESWAPVWERDGELEAWRRLRAAREETDERYQKAVAHFTKAREAAPAGSDERGRALRALEDVNWDRYQTALSGETVTLNPEHYWSQMEALGLGTYRGSAVSLGSDPPGAEVHCFRYEEHEARLVPIPFHPASGPLGKPFLTIERTWEHNTSPFRIGDRVLEVGGKEARLEGELVKALGSVAPGAEVEVVVLRAGKREALRWIPFPRAKDEDPTRPSEPSRVVSVREQFGFAFAGYPLDFAAGGRLGVTGPGAPVTVSLPRGSYLFVLRKEGCAEARFPVATPRAEALSETVRLFKEGEIPPGFIYIPAGPAWCGGGSQAEQNLEPGERRVEGFFMSRFEVTFEEYLEFVNDRGMDAMGEAVPSRDEVKEELQRAGEAMVRLIPWNERENYKPLLIKDEKTTRWELNREFRIKKEHPVFGMPHLAALEYAEWFTRRKGGGWTYRLPTDLEWEKAARGVDRRPFVWGNYAVSCFCCSNPGRRSRSPEPGGGFPFDEGAFGVRDLAGSVSEHAIGRTQAEKGLRYTSIRGGNFYNTDDLWLRAATRNGIFPERSAINTGFRLVAELRRESR